MILNIRGTSGTGKSTIARQLMACYEPNPLRYRRYGRKQPLGYRYAAKDRTLQRDLAVVGHYETDCGGADTIPDYDDLVSLVRQGAIGGMDVLFEGLLFSGDVKRTVALHEWTLEVGEELAIVAIQLDLHICVDSVNQRRREKAERVALKNGTEPVYRGEVPPKNTVAKHRGLTLACSRLEAAGVTVYRPEGRLEAFTLCKSLLRLP
jgi:hypothetical protein